MTSETLLFLQEILGSVTLSAGNPDFDTRAAQISKARVELEDAIKATLLGPS